MTSSLRRRVPSTGERGSGNNSLGLPHPGTSARSGGRAVGGQAALARSLRGSVRRLCPAPLPFLRVPDKGNRKDPPPRRDPLPELELRVDPGAGARTRLPVARRRGRAIRRIHPEFCPRRAGLGASVLPEVQLGDEPPLVSVGSRRER